MKTLRPLFLIVSLILMVGLACAFGGAKATKEPTSAPEATTAVEDQPTEESADTPTDEPTEATVDEPTETTEAPSTSGDQFFTEEFDQDLSKTNWTSLVEGENKEKATFGVASGAFKIDLEGANTKVKMEYLAFDYTDVSLTVDTDNRGKNTGAVLLICRASAEGWYQVQIANDGRFWIQAYDKIGLVKKGINLISNGGSTHILSGRKENKYTFTCSGNSLILSVNGFEERNIKDSKYNYTSGHIAFGLEAVTSLPIITLFNSLEVSQP